MNKLPISVLYVEDEYILRMIYEKVLKGLVEELYLAGNGQEGLEIYREKKPDLIITDIQMPIMSGLEMIQEIKQIDKNIRIVIMSAYSEVEYFMEAIKLGVKSFLLKPVDFGKLKELVRELAHSILLERNMKEQERKRREAERSLQKLNEELEERIHLRTIDLEKEITERKQAENELKQLNINLENRVQEELKKREKQQNLLIQKSKLESLGELAAGIAHEINQPLGGLSMGLDNILFKLNSDKVTPEYLEKKIESMFQDIERIRKIINHVRIFSRDQENENLVDVNLKEVVDNALSMVRTQYKNHNVDISTNVSEDCIVQGNKFKLEQVMLNLLSNAKFAVDKQADSKHTQDFTKKIAISSKVVDGRIELEIFDNGTGISDKNLNNIFDPFFTTKDVESGTGLGLSISYGIIKEMKGSIDVESKEGEYTLMKLVLPRLNS